MQGFLWKIKAGIQRYMIGRHGVDQFSLALMYTAIVVNVLSLLPYLGLLSYLSMAMLVFSLFRVFSKNNTRRYQENAWYLKRFGSIPGELKKAYVRFKNRKAYLYFSCPDCHAKLRVPRGKGDVTVKCGQCGRAIPKKS